MEDAIRGRFSARARGASRDAAGKPVELSARILERIEAPADLKPLHADELASLCAEIREFVIDVVSQKGGHLGASLGVVELTVALLATLDMPADRLVWDTGHQAYVHKVLTGRRDALWTIRQRGGISGFLKREESPFDAFGAGHASTSISAALGMAAARDLAGKHNRVVAILGDGAMTGGLAYEALNNAGQSGRNLLVILNDNGMSIAPNVGAIAHYLTSLTANPHVKRLHDDLMHVLERLPALGEPVGELTRRLEGALKSVLVPGGLFQALGFSYFGPVDGHDLDLLLGLLPNLYQRQGPVLLHVLTKKGKGLAPAEADDESFHGVNPFDKITGKTLAAKTAALPAYTAVFGQAMLEAAEAFPKLVAITAAMPTGTGLNPFKDRYPARFFDVGIAEAHGVCFAAGLACDGARPVATIYSTFLQRAYDQICHDVALQHLPVVFALDRAGLVGADGPTHHGTLDLSYLRCVPGMVVAAPKDGNELRDLLWTSLAHEGGPFAFRWPRDTVPEGYDPKRAPRTLPVGSWEVLETGSQVAFLAVGAMVPVALEARKLLAASGVAAAVINCRFVKPMDLALLREIRGSVEALVTVEENAKLGGFGEGVMDALIDLGLSLERVTVLGLPDEFVGHGTRQQLLEQVGLTPSSLASEALRTLGRTSS